MSRRVSVKALLVICVVSFVLLWSVVPSLADHWERAVALDRLDVVLQPLASPTPIELTVVAEFPTMQIPQLTAGEVTTATLLAEAHPIVQQLTASQAYSVTTGVWHAYDYTKNGASVMISLENETDLAADWPYVDTDANGRPIYPVQTYHEEYVGITQVYVLVDIVRDEVVEILPDPLAEPANP